MCKKYYVKVNGLGDDGKEQLINAGISSDDILVVDDEHRNKHILDAIQKACGVTYDKIVSSDRKRDHSIARMIYVRFALVNGDTTQRLCEELKRDRTSLDYYLSVYDDLMAYNKSFLAIVTSVEKTLNDDPCWCPPKLQKPVRRKKKGKKRKRAVIIQRTPEEIEAILDKRQLKIPFDFTD